MAMEIQNCIILCAGLGKRMGIYTKDRPKALLEIFSYSFLEWHLKMCLKMRIKNIWINAFQI